MVHPIDQDRYGRTVAIIYDQAGRNLNEAQVTAGMAWVYGQYCKADVCREWREWEKQARRKKAGLWTDKNPTPPWEWRKAKE